MSSDAVRKLFDSYSEVFNEALKGKPDLAALAALYEDSFIGAVPAGVMAGSKGKEFDEAMSAGFDRSRKIGTKSMSVQRVEVENIDPIHVMARVDWRATYETSTGEKQIDFTNVYLVRVIDNRATVFGWITGDEEAELKKHGIV
ncbi:hypothetical protein [Brevundimonas sp. GCM10030266]|uniref:hypothetical protein n=1 Tax=Brevundimonas sp. GCM10030266 TaxID=3273386 RepID=UPI00361A4F0D